MLLALLPNRSAKGFCALPGALCGGWSRGEGQVWLYHHVMEREETTQNDVAPFLQHWQGQRAWDHPAMLALILTGGGGGDYHAPQKAPKRCFYTYLKGN